MLNASALQGIPPTLRTFIWMEVSGAAAKKAAVGNNYFNNMCLAGDSSPYLKDIDKVAMTRHAANIYYVTNDGGVVCADMVHHAWHMYMSHRLPDC